MPSFDATVSDTTVPTNASVIDTFSEAKSHDDRNGKADHRRPERLPRVTGDGLRVFDQRFCDRNRAGEDEVGYVEKRADRLPDDEEQDREHPRRRLLHPMLPRAGHAG